MGLRLDAAGPRVDSIQVQQPPSPNREVVGSPLHSCSVVVNDAKRSRSGEDYHKPKGDRLGSFRATRGAAACGLSSVLARAGVARTNAAMWQSRMDRKRGEEQVTGVVESKGAAKTVKLS